MICRPFRWRTPAVRGLAGSDGRRPLLVGLAFLLAHPTPACLAGRLADDPEAPEEDPVEEREDVDEEGSAKNGDKGIFGEFSFGIEADLEYAYEEEGDEKTNEFTFDEVGFILDTAWWHAEVGIKYKSEGTKGLIVEEAGLRVGGTEAWPWFVTVGRTVLPFGEYDSWFVGDPLVTLVGETDDDTIILGFTNDLLEVAMGAFKGNLAEDGDLDFVASAKVAPWEGSRMGMSWTSDLSESVELRELHEEALVVGESSAGRVNGFDAFAALDEGVWLLELEYVSALASFPAGFLDEERRRPSAWNLELAVHPAPRWELASRVEASTDLPQSPRRQYGLAVSYEFSEHVTATGDYLHGPADGDEPRRNLVSARISFEF